MAKKPSTNKTKGPPKRGADILRFVGKVKLPGDPVKMQKDLRRENEKEQAMVIVIDQKKLKKGELKTALLSAMRKFEKQKRKPEISFVDLAGGNNFGEGDPLLIQKEMRRDKD